MFNHFRCFLIAKTVEEELVRILVALLRAVSHYSHFMLSVIF